MELDHEATDVVPFPVLTTVRAVAHPEDGTPFLHPMGLNHWVHSHILHEDDSHRLKQITGAHINRWHFPVKEAPDARGQSDT